MLDNWIKNIQFAVLPGRCLLCGKPTQTRQDICSGCKAGLPLNERHCRCCAQPLASSAARNSLCGRCQKNPPAFDSCFAAFRYQQALVQLHHNFKFKRKLAAGRLLAELMAELLTASPRSMPELLIPVPLHAHRLRERGFNQALELSRVLSALLSVDLDADSLVRTRHTRAQSSLPRNQRSRNIRNAFRAASPIGCTHVAVVDDVMTTGVTVNEIARVLRREAVGRIEVWVVASTPRGVPAETSAGTA
jgi:ComF family protein